MGKLKLGKTLAESAENAERIGKLKLGVHYLAESADEWHEWADMGQIYFTWIIVNLPWMAGAYFDVSLKSLKTQILLSTTLNFKL